MVFIQSFSFGSAITFVCIVMIDIEILGLQKDNNRRLQAKQEATEHAKTKATYKLIKLYWLSYQFIIYF